MVSQLLPAKLCISIRGERCVGYLTGHFLTSATGNTIPRGHEVPGILSATSFSVTELYLPPRRKCKGAFDSLERN